MYIREGGSIMAAEKKTSLYPEAKNFYRHNLSVDDFNKMCKAIMDSGEKLYKGKQFVINYDYVEGGNSSTFMKGINFSRKNADGTIKVLPLEIIAYNEKISGNVVPTAKSWDEFKRVNADGKYLPEEPRSNTSVPEIHIKKYPSLGKDQQPTETTPVSPLFQAYFYIDTMFKQLVTDRLNAGKQLVEFSAANKGKTVVTDAFMEEFNKLYNYPPTFPIITSAQMSEITDNVKGLTLISKDKNYVLCTEILTICSLLKTSYKDKTSKQLIKLSNPYAKLKLPVMGTTKDDKSTFKVCFKDNEKRTFDGKKIIFEDYVITEEKDGISTQKPLDNHNCWKVLRSGLELPSVSIILGGMTSSSSGLSSKTEAHTLYLGKHTAGVFEEEEMFTLNEDGTLVPKFAAIDISTDVGEY